MMYNNDIQQNIKHFFHVMKKVFKYEENITYN